MNNDFVQNSFVLNSMQKLLNEVDASALQIEETTAQAPLDALAPEDKNQLFAAIVSELVENDGTPVQITTVHKRASSARNSLTELFQVGDQALLAGLYLLSCLRLKLSVSISKDKKFSLDAEFKPPHSEIASLIKEKLKGNEAKESDSNEADDE